jgi:hypothetical protein
MEYTGGSLAAAWTNRDTRIEQYEVTISAVPKESSLYYIKEGETDGISATTPRTITGKITSATEANTFLISGGIINKVLSWVEATAASKPTTIEMAKVLVFPDTIYTVSIKAKNIFDTESSAGTESITTSSPEHVINLLGPDNPIPFHNHEATSAVTAVTDGDIIGYNSYEKRGFLLASDYTYSPDLGATTYQITKANPDWTAPPLFDSALVTHRMNKTRLSEFTTTYSSEVARKLRQFKIYNTKAASSHITGSGHIAGTQITSDTNYGWRIVTSAAATSPIDANSLITSDSLHGLPKGKSCPVSLSISTGDFPTVASGSLNATTTYYALYVLDNVFTLHTTSPAAPTNKITGWSDLNLVSEQKMYTWPMEVTLSISTLPFPTLLSGSLSNTIPYYALRSSVSTQVFTLHTSPPSTATEHIITFSGDLLDTQVMNTWPVDYDTIYTFGNDTDFKAETRPSSPYLLNALAGMVSITSTDSKTEDVYAAGRDPNNKGYWWQEEFKYNITISNIEHICGKPVKLKFEARYNKTGELSTPPGEAARRIAAKAAWTLSTLDNLTDIASVEKVIFKNASNNNDVIYFDKMSSSDKPSAALVGGTPHMITSYVTPNKINGVPNLYIIPLATWGAAFGSGTAEYRIQLKYKLTKYSKYYGLDPSENFVEHEFIKDTDAVITAIVPQKWGASPFSERGEEFWTVTNLLINHDSTTDNTLVKMGSTTLPSGKAEVITLRLKMLNTVGSDTHSIDSSATSAAHKFIHDKPSVVELQTLLSGAAPSLKNAIQVHLTPTSPTAPSPYTAVDSVINPDQLNMWNGYFYSKSGWLNAVTPDIETNKDHYGLVNADVMFQGATEGYKYVIFEYSYTAVADYTPFGGFVVFGDKTDIDLSDFAGGSQGKKDVKIYLYIQNYNMNSHYYLNIGEMSPSANVVTAEGQRIVYAGGGLGQNPYNPATGDTNSTWSSGGSKIATSGNGGWDSTTATGDVYTARPNPTAKLKRTLKFIYNKIVTNYAGGTSGPGSVFKHYLCIGIKNNIDRKVSKPDLYIYASARSVKKLA